MSNDGPQFHFGSRCAPCAPLVTRKPQDRARELSALLPLWPKDIDDLTLDGRRRVIALMERALRAERRRGIAGHWAYDLSRHAALYRAWKTERSELAALVSAQAKRGVRRQPR